VLLSEYLDKIILA